MAIEEDFDGDDGSLEAAEAEMHRVATGSEPVEVREEAPDEPSVDTTSEEERTQSRREKRAARYKRMQEERDEMARERDLLREQMKTNNMLLETLRRQQQPAQAGADPESARLEELRQTKRRIWDEASRNGQNLTAEQVAALESEAEKIADEEMRIKVSRYMREAGVKPHDPQEAQRNELMARHPDVFGNAAAQRMAAGFFDVEVAMGRVTDIASRRAAEDRAADRARQELGLTPVGREPSSRSRARYEGAPRGNSSREEPRKRTIQMTDARKRMANALFSHIEEPAERYKMWAETAGRDLIDAGEA